MAIELSTGEKLSGPLITVALEKKEGWHDKSGSKWQTIPELMLRYRAASWFVSAYAPELAMGLQTVEEVKDTYDLEPAPGGVYQVATDKIRRDDSAETEPALEPSREEAKRGKKAPAKSAGKQSAPKETAPAETDPETKTSTGETSNSLFDGNGTAYLVACPDNDKQVDERDCYGKSCREGCPAFE